jgi:hypothetical protein
MSHEVAGSLAFFVEGFVFFVLQESELLSAMGYFGKYCKELFHGWAVSVSTVLSILLVFLPPFLPAKYKDSSVVIWIVSAICFFLSGYGVWRRERIALEQEKKKNSHVSGGIAFGYLDRRIFVVTPTSTSSPGSELWMTLPDDKCYLNFQIDPVNHSHIPAYFRPSLTPPTLELRFGGYVFKGDCWVHTDLGLALAVNDPRRPHEKRLIDVFDGLHNGLEQSKPWTGNIGFFIEGCTKSLVAAHASKNNLMGYAILKADVAITLYDTLGHSHPIGPESIEILLDRLCTISDIAKL